MDLYGVPNYHSSHSGTRIHSHSASRRRLSTPPRGAGSGSVIAMTREAHAATDIEAVDELRFLADSLRRVDAATATAVWDDGDAMARVIADAYAELTSAHGAIVEDIAAAGASAAWRSRAADHALVATRTREAATTAGQARANAVVAVALARACVAEAVLAVAHARNLDVGDTSPTPTRRTAVLRVAAVSGVGGRTVDEVRHVIADKPRAILIRLLITLGISLSLVSSYHFSGWTKHDDVR